MSAMARLTNLLTGNDDELVLGDFNLHHPMWGGPEAVTDNAADDLIDDMEERRFGLWLPPGTITRRAAGSHTTIDLVWGSYELSRRLVACNVDETIHTDSDHLPIRTIIDVKTPLSRPPRRRNWKAMDRPKFTKFVEENLGALQRWKDYTGNNISHDQINTAVNQLVEIIQRGVTKSTPWVIPSAWANPGFTPEYQEAIRASRRAFRRYTASRGEDEWQLYYLARNQKGRVINHALRKQHRARVRQVTDQGVKGIWKIARWAQGGRPDRVIPALKRPEGGPEAKIIQEKAECLRGVLFPKPPEADLADIGRFHPRPLEFPAITAREVCESIQRAPPEKAPGPDGIPNHVWHKLANYPGFIETLRGIFEACVHAGYNTRHFQESVIVVLRKGGPRDFRLLKSYRPVALLNTLGKLLESVITTRLLYILEERGLLPKTHLGGRKLISVDHAIQQVIEAIRGGWGHGLKVSMLLMDISGAYDNVAHQRLVDNIRRLGLAWIALWIASFLQNRATRLLITGVLRN
jgi:hypothetical protein